MGRWAWRKGRHEGEQLRQQGFAPLDFQNSPSNNEVGALVYLLPAHGLVVLTAGIWAALACH